MPKEAVKPNSFAEVFRERINEIERRALKAGTSLTATCKGVGVSRATPDRWRRKIPRTVAIIDEMEAWVSRIEKKRQHKQPDLIDAAI